jgi:pimeloyl-ACP methyl ester carboxylesterase
MRRTLRRVLATASAVVVLLVTGVLYGAYVYRPAEARDYRPPAEWTAASRYVDTPLARFHYVRQGSGSPVVLLSPGAAWTFAWKDQIPALARGHTVYVLDLPGQGFTRLTDPGFRWDLQGMTAAIDSFLDAVGVRQAALVGSSWSGGWALAYAQRHPDRVTKLALLDSSGLAVRDSWTWEILKYPVIGEFLTNTVAGSRSAARSAAERVLAHPERVTDDLVDAFWAPNTFGDNLEANYRLERGLDWRETERAMPATRQPTLVIWGERDTTLPAWQAHRFGELLPDARVRVLSGCGHAVMLDCPQPVNTLLEEFLG